MDALFLPIADAVGASVDQIKVCPLAALPFLLARVLPSSMSTALCGGTRSPKQQNRSQFAIFKNLKAKGNFSSFGEWNDSSSIIYRAALGRLGIGHSFQVLVHTWKLSTSMSTSLFVSILLVFT
jgi:hypothetical protein